MHKVKEQLHLLGMSPGDVEILAEKKGEHLPRQTIYLWYKGTAPTLRLLYRLCRVIDCKIEDLI